MCRWLLLMGFLLGLVASRPAPLWAQADPPSEILALVNQVRASYGLAGLSNNAALAAAAQGHAQWMAATVIYSHTETNGSTPQTRANSAGYVGWASENIVGGTDLTPVGGVAWWQHSPVHLSNMTSSRYVEAGVGFATNGDQNFYVLLLGVPDTGAAPRNALPATSPIMVTPIELSPPDSDGSVKHVVQTGQTAWAIAARYGVTLADLLWLNHLSDEAFLKPGDQLIVRLGEGQTPPPTPTPPMTHVVKTGQTLWTIAALYQISVEELIWLNNLSADTLIYPGDTLIVHLLPGQTRPPVPTATPQLAHVVQAGDSLWSIAARYGLRVDELLTYNQLSSEAVIRPGDNLWIVLPVTPTPLPLPTSTATPTLAAPTPPALILPSATPGVVSATPTPVLRLTPPPAATQGTFSAEFWLWGALGLTLLAGGFLLAARR